MINDNRLNINNTSMRIFFIILAFTVCNIAFAQQIDISGEIVDNGEIIESAEFGFPYDCTLDLSVYSQTVDLSDAIVLKSGITCTIEFLYFSPSDTKLVLTTCDSNKETLARREWKNVSLYYHKFKNGSIGYEIRDITNTYSFARLYPTLKGNKYWGYFNPVLMRNVL